MPQSVISKLKLIDQKNNFLNVGKQFYCYFLYFGMFLWVFCSFGHSFSRCMMNIKVPQFINEWIGPVDIQCTPSLTARPPTWPVDLQPLYRYPIGIPSVKLAQSPIVYSLITVTSVISDSVSDHRTTISYTLTFFYCGQKHYLGML